MERSGDASGDKSGEPSGDARWLTYDELAHIRRISRASAERLVFRRHFRRQRGNDHVVRALVPADYLSGDGSPDASGDASPDPSPDASPDRLEDRDAPALSALLAGALAALESAVAALTARAEAAEAGRDGERARADDLRTQISILNVEMEVMRAGLESDLDAARAEAAAALQRAEVLEATEAERQARGLVARLRAALRGR